MNQTRYSFAVNREAINTEVDRPLPGQSEASHPEIAEAFDGAEAERKRSQLAFFYGPKLIVRVNGQSKNYDLPLN